MSGFKLQVTLTGATIEEMVAALDAAREQLVGGKPAKAESVAPAPKVFAPKVFAPKVTEKPVQKPVEKAPEPKELTYDYEKDIVPKVLKAVEVCGKTFVAECLAKYGAKRASEIDPTWMPEFLGRLEEGINGSR
jgi:hypothetical protein